jgi:Tfp pilus assembly protein PilN
MSNPEINLVPDYEKFEQKQGKLVKSSTYFTLLMLIVVSGVAGYFYYQAFNLQSAISVEDVAIEDLRNDISDLSEVEVNARNLEKKLNAITTVLDSRIAHSEVIKEVYGRKPQNVVIESFTVTEDSRISITGEAFSYDDVSDFVATLNEVRNENLVTIPNLFIDIQLPTVSKSSQSGSINYLIQASFDPGAL